MSVSNKTRALLNLKGKKSHELAAYFGISSQAMRNKLSRDTLSAEDLIKIADFLGCELAFILSDSQKITLDAADIRHGHEHRDVHECGEVREDAG